MQFGLLRFTVGSGTFQRNKMVFIHFNGEKCSGLHKAKCNKHADKVTQAFGQCAVKLTFGEQDEVGLDNIVKETKHLFASDGHMEISISDIKADYESMLTKSRQNEIEALLKGDADTQKRKTAKEMGVSATDALALVNKPMGAFNWALFEPDASELTLWDAGSLGVGEMNTLLPDDQVLRVVCSRCGCMLLNTVPFAVVYCSMRSRVAVVCCSMRSRVALRRCSVDFCAWASARASSAAPKWCPFGMSVPPYLAVSDALYATWVTDVSRAGVLNISPLVSSIEMQH